MCEFCKYKSMADAFVQRYGAAGILTPQMKALFPYALQPGCCPVCGRPLSHEERNPVGRASRCMCDPCYERMILSHVSEECMVCGCRLPNQKIYEQQNSPREVRAKIHEGDCMARWVMVHIVGNSQREYQPAGMIEAPQPEYAEADYVDADYYEVPAESEVQVYDRHDDYAVAESGYPAANRPKALPSPVRALPEPQEQETVPDFNFSGWKTFQREPVLRKKR